MSILPVDSSNVKSANVLLSTAKSVDGVKFPVYLTEDESRTFVIWPRKWFSVCPKVIGSAPSRKFTGELRIFALAEAEFCS